MKFRPPPPPTTVSNCANPVGSLHENLVLHGMFESGHSYSRVCNLRAHDTLKLCCACRRWNEAYSMNYLAIACTCLLLFLWIALSYSFVQRWMFANRSFFRRSTCFWFVENLSRICFVFRSLHIVHGLKCVEFMFSFEFVWFTNNTNPFHLHAVGLYVCGYCVLMNNIVYSFSPDAPVAQPHPTWWWWVDA